MTEKTVTEAEKAELRDMLGKVTAPCPFKPGDMVVCVEQDGRFDPLKEGKVVIVHRVRKPEDRGWHGTEDMSVLFKKYDEDLERWCWDIRCTRSWRFKLA